MKHRSEMDVLERISVRKDFAHMDRRRRRIKRKRKNEVRSTRRALKAGRLAQGEFKL